jgi:hypothetical protein
MSHCGLDQAAATLLSVNRNPQEGSEMQKKSTLVAALVGAAVLAPTAAAGIAVAPPPGLLGPPIPAPTSSTPKPTAAPLPVPPVKKPPIKPTSAGAHAFPKPTSSTSHPKLPAF